MGIRTKPRQAPAATEEQVNALIEKGGTVATSHANNNNPDRIFSVQLRLSQDLINRIDQARKKQRVPPSRHSWILEALLEKLEP